MKSKSLLLLASTLIIGCAPNPQNQHVYLYDDLGIQIAIPDNWRQISSAEAGQDNILWKDGEVPPIEEELYLGYFDPDSGEKKGIFILTIISEEEASEQIQEDLEETEGFEKIRWKGHSCYLCKHDFDTSAGMIYAVTQKGSTAVFMAAYSQSHADPITNIFNEINF